MAKRTRKQPPGPCNVGDAVEAIGAGWKGDILWHLREGPQRFMELRRSIPAISPKVLTQALRALEQDGLVRREQFAEIPPRVEYSMTTLGRSAAGVLQAIAEWWKRNGAAIQDPELRK
ncbi:MAG: helix-turn-helix transcriptional regulator [Planctomycetes bacterium]|nr:helix-turn-helix transcriptional regulator [Planctomycetota bacterium]